MEFLKGLLLMRTEEIEQEVVRMGVAILKLMLGIQNCRLISEPLK